MDIDTQILIVGDERFEMYAKAFVKGFLSMGYHNTYFFPIDKLMHMKKCNICDQVVKKIENRYVFGTVVREVNNLLEGIVEVLKPQLIFMYSVRVIYPRVVEKMQLCGGKVFIYNNDNPFSKSFRWYYWRMYRKLIPIADVTFVYRRSNIGYCKNIGARDVHLLRSYYIESRNFPIDEDRKKKTIPDVVFLGHYEDDGRDEYVVRLAEAGIVVGLPLKGWEKIAKKYKNIVCINSDGDCYNIAIASAKIALIFLSTINEDLYTRRCFEIPAAKTMMCSIYSNEIAELYKEDKEIVFFHNPDELLSKVSYYLDNNARRKAIAEAGYQRLMRDGHEVKDRIRQIVSVFDAL